MVIHVPERTRVAEVILLHLPFLLFTNPLVNKHWEASTTVHKVSSS